MNILFRKTRFVSLFVAGSLALAGCSGSSGGGSDDTSSELTTETISGVTTQVDKVEETTSGVTVDGDTATLSGKAMDGYLENAKVCLDTNRNGTCDADEPSTTSGADGSYTLSGIPAGDATKYPIVVEVIKGQTVDKDTGKTVTKSYTMKAPAGQASVVSPITSLIQNTLENNPTMTVEKAEKELKATLGLDGNVRLMDDYVAKGSEQDGEEYKVVHKVAQVVAEKVAEALETVDTTLLDEESKNALASLIYDKTMEVIDDVISKIEIVTLSGTAIDDINTSNLNVSLDISGIDETSIAKKKEYLTTNEEIADSVVKVSSSSLFQENLKKGDVFYFIPSAEYNSDLGTYEFVAWTYGQQVVNNQLVATMNEYNSTTETFEEKERNSASSYTYSSTIYSLTSEGWKKHTMTNDNEDEYTVSFPDEGTVLYTQTETGYKYQYDVSAIIPLEGISIAQYASTNIENSTYATIDTSVFPEGSLAFEIGFSSLSAEYEVWAGSTYCSFDSCETYDYGYVHTGYDATEHNISSIIELKEVYALNNSAGLYYYDYESIYPYIQFGTDGTVHYFGYDYIYNETYGYYTQTGERTQRELTGKLTKKTVNGQELWFIERPESYEDDLVSSWAQYYDSFIIEMDGLVREGEVYYPGRESFDTERFYNNAACVAMAKSVTGLNFTPSVYTQASATPRTVRTVQAQPSISKDGVLLKLPTPLEIKRKRYLSLKKKQ